MDILRITARWSGFTGGPGYSNFFFSADGGFWDGGLLGDSAQAAADSARDKVREAFFQITNLLPAGLSIDIDQEAVILDSDTGEAIGFAEVDGVGVGDGTGSGGYAGPSGAVVNWITNDYRFGRRIRGRTFLVPLAGDAYEDDGTLTSSALSDLRSFGGQLLGGSGSAQLGVWSRPRDGQGGVFATAVNYRVPDMAAVLRSRRD